MSCLGWAECHPAFIIICIVVRADTFNVSTTGLYLSPVSTDLPRHWGCSVVLLGYIVVLLILKLSLRQHNSSVILPVGCRLLRIFVNEKIIHRYG